METEMCWNASRRVAPPNRRRATGRTVLGDQLFLSVASMKRVDSNGSFKKNNQRVAGSILSSSFFLCDGESTQMVHFVLHSAKQKVKKEEE